MENKPPGSRNPLKEFTAPECEYFRQNCNFTPDELEVFNLRIRDWSVVHIGMELNMCDRTVVRKIRSIKRKILKVL